MNFTQARFNMVEQQIRPWDVLDFDLLDVLNELPRERFVAAAHHGHAYADMPLPLPNGGQMLEPKIVARLVQGLQLTAADTVLEIGTGSGYATAVLAKLARKVISVDIDGQQQQRAAAVLSQLGLQNVEFCVADGLAGIDASYTAVYVGGACPSLPEKLLAGLPSGGRMVAIVGEAPVMRALSVRKEGEAVQQSVMFDTLVPMLQTEALPAWGKFRF